MSDRCRDEWSEHRKLVEQLKSIRTKIPISGAKYGTTHSTKRIDEILLCFVTDCMSLFSIFEVRVLI